MGIHNTGRNAGPMCIPPKEQISLSTSFVESFAGIDMGTRVQPGNTHVHSGQGIEMAYSKLSPFLVTNRHGYSGPARQYPCLFLPRNRHDLLKAISVPW